MELGEEKGDELNTDSKVQRLGTDMNYRHKYIIPVVLLHTVVQLFSIYGLYAFLFKAKVFTMAWSYFFIFLSGMGVTLGAHRLFSHRSYKAVPLLRVVLVIAHTISGQNHIFWWARDHRLHHKFSDTDADPYNASRGFFFSHMKWLMVKRHPLVTEKGKQIDMSDLEADKLVMFQRKYIIPLHIFIAFLIPTLVPVYVWNEQFWTSFFAVYCFRYGYTLHLTWSVNSFAHFWGSKPIDKRIKPVQSKFVDFVTWGEGWHNYHHTFPWDCGMSEFGYKKGISTRMLEFWESCGLAYDLKRASTAIIKTYGMKHGDGSLSFAQVQ